MTPAFQYSANPANGPGDAGFLNATDQMEGTIHGTAITVINGEEAFQAFSLKFRSAKVALGETVCGE